MKTNKIRQTAGIVYCVLGVAVFFFWDSMNTKSVFTVDPARHDDLATCASIAWGVTWSALGIGVGLINTRTHNKGKLDSDWRHYFVLYYPFALFVGDIGNDAKKDKAGAGAGQNEAVQLARNRESA